MEHRITRLRHELKRRQITVKEVIRLTPGMLRVVFAGEELADFNSMAPDDHVKLFFPGTGGEDEKRDYTPRAFDNKAQTLTIDFALHEGAHEAGPATRWAMNAKAGDVLQIGGPRGSVMISPDFDWWLLIGDETALPAIARRLETLPSCTKIRVVITVCNPADEQYLEAFSDKTGCELVWLHRPTDQADDPALLLNLLQTMELPQGDGFLWIATEGVVARAIREYLVNTRGHPLVWTKSAGYWLKGTADAHDNG